MLQTLVLQYGYLAILLGTFLEGETILLLGGIAAQQGWLDLRIVMATAFIGSFAGDQLCYLLARRYARDWIARRPALHAKVARVAGWIERRATLVILSFRFMYGVRNVTPMAVALSGISPRRFLLLNGIAAAVWAMSVGGVGYLFGMGAVILLAELHGPVVIGLAGTAALATAARLMWRKRRSQSRA